MQGGQFKEDRNCGLDLGLDVLCIKLAVILLPHFIKDET